MSKMSMFHTPPLIVCDKQYNSFKIGLIANVLIFFSRARIIGIQRGPADLNSSRRGGD